MVALPLRKGAIAVDEFVQMAKGKAKAAPVKPEITKRPVRSEKAKGKQKMPVEPDKPKVHSVSAIPCRGCLS